MDRYNVSIPSNCLKDVASFLKKLDFSENESDWMDALKIIEMKMDCDNAGILEVINKLVISCSSLKSLKSLMITYVREVSILMEKLDLLSNEQSSLKTFKVVKRFLSLCANHHVILSGKDHGYSAEFYQVLPSLASVYIDLFLAAFGSKKKLKKLSRKLYGWLKLEMNERCLKTALLEVSHCTPSGGKIVSPILKKLLSHPTSFTFEDNLDYLLHFVLLRKWSFVCDDLKELIESNSRLKAPETFVQWLKEKWPQSRDFIPEDKSFKGRRVSELFLELDEKAIEELVDVFSNCLLSKLESQDEATGTKSTDNVFVIDKKGNEDQKAADFSIDLDGDRTLKSSTLFSESDNDLKIDYFMLSDIQPNSTKNSKPDDGQVLKQEEEELMEFETLDSGSGHDDTEDQALIFYDKSSSPSKQPATNEYNNNILDENKKAPLKNDVKKEQAKNVIVLGDSDSSDIEIIKDDLDLACVSPTDKISNRRSPLQMQNDGKLDQLRVKGALKRKIRDDDNIEICDLADTKAKKRKLNANGQSISSEKRALKVKELNYVSKDDIFIVESDEKKLAEEMFEDESFNVTPKKNKSPLKKIANNEKNTNVTDPSSPEIIGLKTSAVGKKSPLKAMSDMMEKNEFDKSLHQIAEFKTSPVKNKSPLKAMSQELKKTIEINELSSQIIEVIFSPDRLRSPKLTELNTAVRKQSPCATLLDCKKSPFKQKTSIDITKEISSPNKKKRNSSLTTPISQQDKGNSVEDNIPIKSDVSQLLNSAESSQASASCSEQQISLMLTQIRGSVRNEEKICTSMKTCSLTKSEKSTPEDGVSAESSTKSLPASILSDWLIKPTSLSKMEEKAEKNIHSEKIQVLSKLSPKKRQSPRFTPTKALSANTKNNTNAPKKSPLSSYKTIVISPTQKEIPAKKILSDSIGNDKLETRELIQNEMHSPALDSPMRHSYLLRNKQSKKCDVCSKDKVCFSHHASALNSPNTGISLRMRKTTDTSNQLSPLTPTRRKRADK